MRTYHVALAAALSLCATATTNQRANAPQSDGFAH